MNRFWLSDETNNSTEVFTSGSTLFIEGRGLPSTSYDFHLLNQHPKGPATLLARFSTDHHGALAATPLIPCLSVLNQGTDRAQSRPYTEISSAQRSFVIRVRTSEQRFFGFEDLRFTVAQRSHVKRVFPCDANGRLQTGIDKGNGPVSVLLQNFPAGCVRIYVVSRQYGWQVGDPIEPIHTNKGTICSRLIYHDGDSKRIVTLGESRDIPAGSYQFVARVVPSGWHESTMPNLLRDDVVSDRQGASLIVRLPFYKRVGHDNGMVLTPEMEQPQAQSCFGAGESMPGVSAIPGQYLQETPASGQKYTFSIPRSKQESRPARR